MKRNLKKRKKWLKLISLIFSFFIWLYVVSTAEIEKDKSVSLVYNVPSGFSLKEDYPKNLNVSVKGPRLLVRKYLDTKDEINIPLTLKYRRGKNRYQYNLNQLVNKLPFGLELLSLSPKTIELAVERTIFKKVPVRVNFPVNKAAELGINNIKVTPSEIEISGPATLIGQTEYIQTELLENEDFKKGESREIGLIKGESFMNLSSETVRLNYIINKVVSEFTFKKIPIIFQSTKLIVAVDQKFVNLTLQGDQSILDKVDVQNLQVIATVREGQGKRQTVDVFATIPKGLGLVSIKPNKIKVTLE